MKTKAIISKLIYTLFIAFLLSANYGCAMFMDAELGDKPLPVKEDGSPDFEKIEDMIVEDFRKNNKDLFPQTSYYSPSFIEVSGGLGLDSREDDSETSYCIGAGYNHRISKDNFNRAIYARGFATQHWQNSDNLESSVTRVGAGITYFDRANKTGELDFTYGLDFNLGFGTFENFSVKEDYSELAASLKIGANYEISDGFDIGATITVASWAQQTFEAGGVEFKQDHTWVGLNKDNMIMAYGRIKLD